MLLSLTQAAEATGKSKSTLLRAIRKGRLSAARDDIGAFWIDPAELHRVYAIQIDDAGDAPNDAAMTRHATANDAGDTAIEVTMLREQLGVIAESFPNRTLRISAPAQAFSRA